MQPVLKARGEQGHKAETGVQQIEPEPEPQDANANEGEPGHFLSGNQER